MTFEPLTTIAHVQRGLIILALAFIFIDQILLRGWRKAHRVGLMSNRTIITMIEPKQKTFDIFPKRHELVGIGCRCGNFVTQRVVTDNVHDRLFYCLKCNWIIEPPDGMRTYNVYYDVNEVRTVPASASKGVGLGHGVVADVGKSSEG